jgi:hypothetical protein
MKKIISLIIMVLLFVSVNLFASWTITTNYRSGNGCCLTFAGATLTNSSVLTQYTWAGGLLYNKLTKKSYDATNKIGIIMYETNSGNTPFNTSIYSISRSNVKVKFSFTGQPTLIRFKLFLLRPSSLIK